MEFNGWRKRTGKFDADFKHDFRSTHDYLATLQDTKSQISAILQKATKYPDDFHAIDVDAIISSMGKSLDYGDAVIVDLCTRKKFKLVTDDSDMANAELPITIITA